MFLKIFLDEKGLGDRTPLEPCACGIVEYRPFNKLVEDARASWRERYYEPACYTSFYDADGKRNCVRCTPRWRLKSEAAAQRIGLIELEAYRNWRFKETLTSSAKDRLQTLNTGPVGKDYK